MLQMALTNNDVAAAKEYLMLGAGPEIVRSDGDTHLHQAVEMGDFELVKLLVGAGADCSVEYQGYSMSDLARIKVKKNGSLLSPTGPCWAMAVFYKAKNSLNSQTTYYNKPISGCVRIIVENFQQYGKPSYKWSL